MRNETNITTGESTQHEDYSMVEQTTSEKILQHKADIQAQLDALDAASARPLRAIMSAQAAGKTAAAADLTKLADLESQAVALRTELAGLGA